MNYDYYQKLLKEGRYISIASISPAKPHCAVVFFHATSEGLFWTSTRSSQHSQNLATCPTAFVVLYEENLKEGTGAEKGLYLEGTVTILKDVKEIHKAKIQSTHKANKDRNDDHKLQIPDPKLFMEPSARAVYKFCPTKAWTNIWSPSEGDHRIELDLKQIFHPENPQLS